MKRKLHISPDGPIPVPGIRPVPTLAQTCVCELFGKAWGPHSPYQLASIPATPSYFFLTVRRPPDEAVSPNTAIREVRVMPLFPTKNVSEQ